MAKKNNHNRYLVDFVLKLKEINSLELEIPGGDIKTVIENPEEYALNFVEFQITKNLKNYITAFKIGKEFANKNMGIKDGKGG